MQHQVIKISTLPEEELNHIKQGIEDIKASLSKRTEEDFSSSFIESKQIPKLLGISQKTWQTYRDKGTIPFIQFGSKIWVKRSDLEAFLNRHYITKQA
jgi:excisionase family DNA binding protein